MTNFDYFHTKYMERKPLTKFRFEPVFFLPPAGNLLCFCGGKVSRRHFFFHSGRDLLCLEIAPTPKGRRDVGRGGGWEAIRGRAIRDD